MHKNYNNKFLTDYLEVEKTQKLIAEKYYKKTIDMM